jgi:hypothetical protein
MEAYQLSDLQLPPEDPQRASEFETPEGEE